jgi:hypothetical protein
MRSERFWTLTSKVYDEVHLALWGCAIAFAMFFVVFVAPKLPAAQAKAESQRILRAMAENRQLCERWGLKPGSDAHARCLLDLQKLRTEIRNQTEEQDVQLF